ncbi:MAG: hypothetical protein WCB19_06230, partial [Thermoplasmata archaeon]
LRGELKKLGTEISTTSIRRILAEKRRPPAGRETWHQFMRTQASSIIVQVTETVTTRKGKKALPGSLWVAQVTLSSDRDRVRRGGSRSPS